MILRRWLGTFVLIVVCNCVAVPTRAQNDEARPARGPDVVFVPTPNDVVARMLQMADVKKSDVVYDLGCGDGRIVVAAAKKYGCKAVGYDIDPQRVKESRENAVRNKVEHLVTIEQQDIFTVDLSRASVVALYLLPEMNAKLLPQFEKMKPGSRIVCHNYGIEGLEADETVTMKSREDNVEHFIYLWTTPLKNPDAATTE